jgi:glutaredoxin-like YruB-family protein
MKKKNTWTWGIEVIEMNVKVYTTPTCPYCHMVKQFLKEHNVEFEEVDVSKDAKRAEELVKKSGQMGVPVTEIDGKIIVGFDKDALEEAIKTK